MRSSGQTCMLLMVMLGALAGAHSSRDMPPSLIQEMSAASKESFKLSTFEREFAGGLFERSLTETFNLALAPDTLQLASQEFFDLFDFLARHAPGASNAEDQEILQCVLKLMDAATSGPEPQLVEALSELARRLAAQRKPGGPASRADARPALRRLVLSALLRLRLLIGPLSQPLQQAAHQVLIQLFQGHAVAAASKGIIQLLHISKAGGTSMCQCADLNGCTTESFEPYRNCMIESFDDLPRWGSMKAAMAANITMDQLWFLNFGDKRREDSLLSCAERRDFLRQKKFNFYASEFTLPEAEPCSEFINIVIFRDPIKRMHSHILWIQVSLADVVEINATKVFGQRDSKFWEKLMPGGTNNYYVRTLLGEHMFLEPFVPVTDAHVEKAMQQVLKFDLLVAMEDKLSMDSMIGAGLGWRMPMPHHNNQSSKVIPTELSDKATRQSSFLPTDVEALLAHNQPDVQVYGYVRRLVKLDLLLFNYVTLYDRVKYNMEHTHPRSPTIALNIPWTPCGYAGVEGGAR